MEQVEITEPDSMACQKHSPDWDVGIGQDLFTVFNICSLYILRWWQNYSSWQGYT